MCIISSIPSFATLQMDSASHISGPAAVPSSPFESILNFRDIGESINELSASRSASMCKNNSILISSPDLFVKVMFIEAPGYAVSSLPSMPQNVTYSQSPTRRVWKIRELWYLSIQSRRSSIFVQSTFSFGLWLSKLAKSRYEDRASPAGKKARCQITHGQSTSIGECGCTIEDI